MSGGLDDGSQVGWRMGARRSSDVLDLQETEDYLAVD